MTVSEIALMQRYGLVRGSVQR